MWPAIKFCVVAKTNKCRHLICNLHLPPNEPELEGRISQISIQYIYTLFNASKKKMYLLNLKVPQTFTCKLNLTAPLLLNVAQ